MSVATAGVNGYSIASAFIVGVGFIGLAVPDVRTMRVPVVPAKILTAFAIVGFGLIGLIRADWWGFGRAAIGAALVTAIQAIPYLLQRRRDEHWIGRADLRLGVPFGWTLGWFGIGFVYVGFGVALLSGMVATMVSRRRRIPFVPFLAFGYWFALIWVLA